MFEGAGDHEFFVARNYQLSNGDWAHGYEYASFPSAKYWHEHFFEDCGVHHEVIREHFQLYVDIDHCPELDTTAIVHSLDNVLRGKLKELGLDAGEPYVTRASASGKGSAHMHYNVRFESLQGLKTFMKQIHADIKAGDSQNCMLLKTAGVNGECVPDLAVYSKNRLFRLPYQTKKGERPLIPDDNTTANILNGVVSIRRDVPTVPWDPPAEFPNQRLNPTNASPPNSEFTAKVRQYHKEIEEALGLPDDFLQNASAKRLYDRWILCPPPGGTSCPIKGEATTAPHNAYVWCSINLCRFKCFGALCCKKWRTHETPPYVQKLLFRENYRTFEETLRMKPQSIRSDMNKPVLRDGEVSIGQHMPAIEFGDRTTIVPASRERCPFKVITGKRDIQIIMGMSGGKTHSALDLIKNNPGYSVLIVSCRIAFTRDIIRQFKERDIEITSYLDENPETARRLGQEGLQSAHRLVIQLDSLAKLVNNECPERTRKYDVVFLDELTELLCHFNATTIRHKSRNLVPLLQSFTCQAKHVIVACADFSLSNRGKMFLEACKRVALRIRSETPSDYRHYVEIDPEPSVPEWGGREAKYKREHLGAVLQQLFDIGKRVVVVSNVKSFITEWADPIAGSREKEIFTSDTEFKLPSNDRLKTIQMLAYSPTVGPGVSFDVPFDVVVLYMKVTENAAGCRYVMQMVQRVRKLTTGIVFFAIDGNHTKQKWYREEDVKAEQIALQDRVAEVELFCGDDGVLRRRDTLWAKLNRSATAEKRQDVAFFSKRFHERTLKRGGKFYKLVEIQPIPKPGTEVVIDMNRQVANTPFDPTWKKIDSRNRMTMRDKLRLIRGRLGRWIDAKATPDEIYAFLESYVPKSENPYLAIVKKWERYQCLLGTKPKITNPRYPAILAEMEILRELLCALGIHGSWWESTHNVSCDERDLKSTTGDKFKKLNKFFKKHDEVVRRALNSAENRPRKGFSPVATAAIKLAQQLLNSCGLSTGKCGDSTHFIRKRDTTRNKKRIKYREYGIPPERLSAMERLAELRKRPLGFKPPETISVAFQHVTSTIDDNEIILFGRTEMGSCAVRAPLNPELLCGSRPSDHRVRRITEVTGRDITKWREQVFFKCEFDSVRDYYVKRKACRDAGYQLFDDQLSLEAQWFVTHGLQPCGQFKVTGHSTTKKTTCHTEIFLDNIESSDSDDIELVHVSFDIETMVREGHFSECKRDEIICISVYSTEGGMCFCSRDTPGFKSFPDERSMLDAFLKYVVERDPDFISGHNINGFDNKYIEDRCKILKLPFVWSRMENYTSTNKGRTTTSKQTGTWEQFQLDIPGRVVVDSYELFRSEHKLTSYKLDFLARKFLNRRKKDMPYDQIPIKFQTSSGRAELAEYCVHDSELVYDLLHSQSKLINLVQMTKVTRCQIDDILYRGQGIRTMTLLHHHCRGQNIRIPRSRPNPEAKGFKGAVVLEPDIGMHQDAVVCIDFASLYPSIMQAMNMCYSTIVSEDEIATNGWEENVHYRTVNDFAIENKRLITRPNDTNIRFVTPKVREGVLPAILTELLNERRKVKLEMAAHHGTPRGKILNGKQLALKLCANSIYGFTGAAKGYLPDPRIASSVTKYGRGLILQTKHSVDTNPRWKRSQVIYGDTDSCFIRLSREVCDGRGDALVSQAHAVGTAIANDVTKLFLSPILMEYEAMFVPPFVLLKKKKYFGRRCELGRDPVTYTKGVEMVRRDFCPLVTNTQKKMINMILDGRIEESVAFCQGVVNETQRGKKAYTAFVLTKKLTKHPNDYQSKSIHVELAKRLGLRVGERVEYLVRKGTGRLYGRGITVSEANDGRYELDYDYYVDSLKKVLNRILSVVTGRKDVFLRRSAHAAGL